MLFRSVQRTIRKQVPRSQVKKNNQTLPQTGAHKDMLAIISGAFAVGIGLFGLSTNRKKKK